MKDSVTVLGEVCEIIAGQSPKGSTYNEEGEGVPFFQGKKEFTERILGRPTVWTTAPTRLARPGDILMSVRAPVGPVNQVDREVCIGRGLAALRPGSELNSDFLFWYLRSMEDQIRGQDGAVFPSINKAQIAGLEISLPSLGEQMAIASLLDNVALQIGHLEKNLSAAKRLAGDFQGRIAEISIADTPTADEVRLGDVLDVQNGFAFSSRSFSESGAIGLIRIRDLKSGVTTQTRYSGAFDAEFVVQYGDLLIGMDGEFRCYRWRGEPALLNQRVCRLRNFSERLIPEYLLFVLNAHLKKIEDVTGYATVKHLSSKTIKDIRLQLPSIDDQRESVRVWSHASELADRFQQSVSRQIELARLFESSTIQTAVSGGIR